MRTRFLNIDYFATRSSAPVNFLNLSVPRLPPTLPYSFEENLLRLAPNADGILVIERLPIDAALGKFIAEVIPQNIEVEYGKDCDHDQSVFPAVDAYRFPENDHEAAADDRHKRVGFDFIYFEELDPYALLGSARFSKEKETKIFAEVREVKSSQKLVQPVLKMQYSNKLKESIYSVENINLPYGMEQYTCGLEDDGSVPKQMHHETLPLLEVDDTSLRTFTDPSAEEQVLLLLEKTESQYVQEANPLIDGLEMLDSMHCDVTRFVSDHCLPLPRQGLECQLETLDEFTVMDIINTMENSPSIEETTNCFSPKNPFVFEEFKFHLVDLCQLYEVFFEKQRRFEPEICDWIFTEEMNFKKFDELIVSCELALVDETFRSLPVPILCDDNKRTSLNIIVEEKLSGLKTQSLSATDGIYLDWQLWEEDKCNSENYFNQRILRELELNNIDFDCESSDDGRLVIDFIFPDVILNVQKTEECKESFDMLCEDTSKDTLNGVPSNNSTDHRYPEIGNGGQNAKNISRRASLLHQSMSQVNDLDFFLNPGKTIAGLKTEPVVMVPKRNATVPKKGDLNSIPVLVDDAGDCKYEGQPYFPPVDCSDRNMSSHAGDKAQNCSMPMLVPDVTHAMKSEQTQGAVKSIPVTIVIVNTQNFDTEMIVSRRSLYQRILAMEKGGAQVVERDLDLPVDVIISSAICLVWYNCRNIGKKAMASCEASSCLPLCIENIATNILTLLSFSFSGCILVFEGEVNFLSTVLECSDGLYAAAASLGIDFQVFYSSSCDLTNDVILNSILCANKSCSICPKMAESETLAESFLTKFPSVNPLTAHAIISSGGTLMEFFERSYEQRIHTLQQYQVPVESVALFSTLSRHGEREDSKSIMTDCSSSVSSGPDSDKSHFNVDPVRKRHRYIHSPQKIDIRVNGNWPSKPVNKLPDDMQCPSGVSKQYDCRMPADNDILDGPEWPSSSLKDLFGEKHGVDNVWMMDSSDIFKSFDKQNPNNSLTLEETKEPIFSLDDKLFGWNPGSETTMKNKHEEFIDEVIDFSPMSGNNVSTAITSANLQPWLPEMEQDSTRKSKTARRLSFGRKSHCSFSTADEINSDLRTSVQDCKESLRENESLPDTNVNYNKAPPNHQQMLLEEQLRQRSARISKELPFKEEISYNGGTPLSKAINSAGQQPGSPWTIEFLNKIREKSRLRQQSLPCDTSTPICGFSGNVKKVNKRRSPSIIEFFKYQGGSTSARALEKKKLKQSMQLPHSSKNEKDSASLVPTWTPIDKRSRQTLSFAMNGDGNQTRLVWSNGGAHYPRKKLRNH